MEEKNSKIEELKSELESARLMSGSLMIVGTGAVMYMLGRKDGFKHGKNAALSLVKLASELKKTGESKED